MTHIDNNGFQLSSNDIDDILEYVSRRSPGHANTTKAHGHTTSPQANTIKSPIHTNTIHTNTSPDHANTIKSPGHANKLIHSWEPLDSTWQKKLYSKNFVMQNCEGDGNCQFRSITNALKSIKKTWTHDKLRRLLSKHVNNLSTHDFETLINSYRLEKDTGTFQGMWDPYSIKTKRQLAKEISTSGFNFQGDNISLALLSKALDIDFYLFTDSYSIIDLSGDRKHDTFIVLYYEQSGNSGHYQTIGYVTQDKKQPIQTIFTRNLLSSDLNRIVDKKLMIDYHIQQIGHMQTILTINNILRELQNNMAERFSNNQRYEIIKNIKIYLTNIGFFDVQVPINSFSKMFKVKSVKKQSVKRNINQSVKKKSFRKSADKQNKSVRKSNKGDKNKKIKQDSVKRKRVNKPIKSGSR